ncbi:hypothetical protein [Sodalis sp.]|uniref:hypothetical protein n=1 Tax=Sodalis sp. (in: enterobacteria) TaxID=1898979 RepID=UPI003872AAE6
MAKLQELLRQPGGGPPGEVLDYPGQLRGEYGVNLVDLATPCHLTPQQMMDLHSEASYRGI